MLCATALCSCRAVREYQQERLSEILGEKDSGAGPAGDAGAEAGSALGLGLAHEAATSAPLRAQ